MQTPLLLTGALFVGVMQTYYNKKSSISLKGYPNIVFFSAIRYTFCVAIAIIFLLANNDMLIANWTVLAISALGGISLAVCGIASLTALKRGAVALVGMAGTAGILVPCIAGIFLFRESFSIVQGLGLLLLGVAAWLLVSYSNSLKSEPLSFSFIALLLIILIGNGSTMLAQKLFTTFARDTSASAYSFWSFLFAGATLWIYGALCSRKARARDASELRKPPIIISAFILAVCIFLINQVMTILSASMPSILLFPLYNGIGQLLAALLSAFCFKERLTLRSVCGLFAGVIGLVLINL